MASAEASFGTLLTCIDGRIQLPTIGWMRERFDLEYIDVISEPGIDKLLAEAWPSDLTPVRKKLDISVQAHASKFVGVCGHEHCAGNPVSPEQHREHIRKSVQTVRSWGLRVQVVGLWVKSGDDRWEVEVVE